MMVSVSLVSLLGSTQDGKDQMGLQFLVVGKIFAWLPKDWVAGGQGWVYTRTQECVLVLRTGSNLWNSTLVNTETPQQSWNLSIWVTSPITLTFQKWQRKGDYVCLWLKSTLQFYPFRYSGVKLGLNISNSFWLLSGLSQSFTLVNPLLLQIKQANKVTSCFMKLLRTKCDYLPLVSMWQCQVHQQSIYGLYLHSCFVFESHRNKVAHIFIAFIAINSVPHELSFVAACCCWELVPGRQAEGCGEMPCELSFMGREQQEKNGLLPLIIIS